jgi:AcrR family transcriptional regulator
MTKETPTAKTGMRADAMRNRERILEAAKNCFSANGDDVSLDVIVNEAGVGIGTLYRHFKTRDALVEAVYISEHEKLVLKAAELEKSETAVEALRQWLLAFVDMLATKRAMKSSLSLLFSAKPEVPSLSQNMMAPTIKRLLENAVAAGEVQPSVAPMDLLRALVAIAFASTEPDWHENAGKFVELLIAGMRTSK